MLEMTVMTHIYEQLPNGTTVLVYEEDLHQEDGHLVRCQYNKREYLVVNLHLKEKDGGICSN